MELNPNNPVVRSMDGHWHKLTMAVMLKAGMDVCELTAEDIDKMGDGERAIVVDTRGGGLVLRIVTMEEGKKLARLHGGGASPS